MTSQDTNYLDKSNNEELDMSFNPTNNNGEQNY